MSKLSGDYQMERKFTCVFIKTKLHIDMMSQTRSYNIKMYNKSTLFTVK